MHSDTKAKLMEVLIRTQGDIAGWVWLQVK